MTRTDLDVLVVDDEPALLEIHEWILRELGFNRVHLFDRAMGAAREIEEGLVPSLILLDLSMPEMDGIEFLRVLDDCGFDHDLVLVSSEDDRTVSAAERLAQAYGINVLGHLPKPLNGERLHQLLTIGRGVSADTARDGVLPDLEIRHSARSDDFINAYEPQVSLATGELVGIQCLPGRRYPTEGLLGPDWTEEVIQLVLGSALRDLRLLQERGLTCRLGITLPASVVASEGFANVALEATVRASIAPQRVVLQIHEGRSSPALDSAPESLMRLRLKGFEASIDEFGHGFGFLARMLTVPFNELMMAGGLVHPAKGDGTARALGLECLALGRKLGMRTVAKGVRNAVDWAVVKEAGCDAAQGTFVGEPMSIDALFDWLPRWKGRLPRGLALTPTSFHGAFDRSSSARMTRAR